MDKATLENMINSGDSLNSIARKTKKSLTTIRYWCNKYSLKSQFTNFKGSSKPYKCKVCKVCGETQGLNYIKDEQNLEKSVKEVENNIQ